MLSARSTAVVRLWAGLLAAAFCAAPLPASERQAQIEAGRTAYERQCAECHHMSLKGSGHGPELAGPNFMAKWGNRAVGELEAITRQTMPPSAPGSLSDSVYVGLVAYMLAANGAGGEGEPLVAGSDESLGRAIAGETWDESSAAQAAGAGKESGWESWAAAGTIEGAAQKASGFTNRAVADFRPVTDAMLRNPPPADWLNWRRTLDGQGFSPLDQVDQDNVRNLTLAWVLTMGEGSNQATPLVHDGVMYLPVPGNIVQAVDAATGDLIWEYAYPYPPESKTLGGPTRNLAIYQDRLFMATYDAAIVALDARTGEPLWRKVKADYTQGYTHTSGPTVANGVVISGINGCERFKQGGCFITGHDPQTGEELWRTSTIALPGDPNDATWADLPPHLRAGGDTWIPGSYDPDLDLFYIGTSQAKPWVAASRGMSVLDEALYTNCTLALRPRTGEIVWYYQHIPGETLDMEVGFERVLVDLDGRKWMVTVGKDGILWKLDRANGEFVDFVETMPQNIFEPLNRETGRLNYRKDIVEAGIGDPISACPSIYGGHNWQAAAYLPDRGALVIPLHQLCVEMIGREVQMVEGYGGYGGESRVFPMPGSEGMLGRLTAWDLKTMKPLWDHQQRAMFLTSALATGGGLVFIGDLDRRFKAFSADTGEVLWQARLGAALHGFPISYAVAGEQYIAVPTGMGVFKLLTAKQSPEIYQPNGGNALYVFKLPRPDPTLALIERGRSLELDTPYSPPPGDIDAHYTMGFARTLCSGVFVSGLDEDFAAENIGYFTSPPETRSIVVERHVDHDNKTVSLRMENGVVRTARYVGDLGCVPLPIGETEPFYEPPEIISMLPDAATTAWPMGDVLPEDPLPPEIDQERLQAAVDAFFREGAMSASLVITYKGQIIAERYGEGIDIHTPLESWSMGKSLSATLLGVLIREGVYTLEQAAPIPEWQEEGDPRQSIRIVDILRMSSGLRCRAPQDPDADPALGYYDHLYLYTGTIDSFEWAATRPQQWEPNTVGRYRNCDPVLANYLIRLGVEGRGDAYHQFPQQHLFDRIGVRNLVFQTDPYGNILLQGSDLGPARDWARLGNLYLNDGVANGERILPEGWSDFVSTVAPAWAADGRPIYGAFFWLSGADYGLEPGAVYGMQGAGGQMVDIVPSKGLVIARLGHYAGAPIWEDAHPVGMGLLMKAVPDVE